MHFLVNHDGFIPSCNENGGGVDLQEVSGIDGPIVLFWQVRSEFGWPNHH
jgi:hypothetical protein